MQPWNRSAGIVSFDALDILRASSPEGIGLYGEGGVESRILYRSHAVNSISTMSIIRMSVVAETIVTRGWDKKKRKPMTLIVHIVQRPLEYEYRYSQTIAEKFEK